MNIVSNSKMFKDSMPHFLANRRIHIILPVRRLPTSTKFFSYNLRITTTVNNNNKFIQNYHFVQVLPIEITISS